MTNENEEEGEIQVELNIRHNQNGAMLNVHVPELMRESLSQGLNSGNVDTTNPPTFLQLSVLNEWVVDREVREQLEKLNLNIHVRIPLTSISLNFTD